MKNILEWVENLPTFVIVLVIICTLISLFGFFLRLSLHSHLEDLNKKILRLLNQGDPGLKSSIVEDIEVRFRKASRKLEHVNTGALVDEVYSQEKFNFLGFKLSCEKSENFSRMLPNLLLAFGLVGTFWGISTNLFNMSKTLTSGAINSTDIINNLQPYLQGMGAAFYSSLFAIVCSTGLNFINLWWNTSVAKHLFISSLEDYLDNTYKSDVEGDSRLDKAVNKMVDQQEKFLINFHEKVGIVLEKTFGMAAQKIVDEHAQSNLLARRVYENFHSSSASISMSAEVFRDASKIMGEHSQKFMEANAHMQKTLESVASLSNSLKAAAENLARSNFSEKLELATGSLANTQATFADSILSLVKATEEITSIHKQSVECAEKTHFHLNQQSKTLQEASTVFNNLSQSIQDPNLWLIIDSLNENTKGILPLNNSTKELQTKVSLLGEIMIKNIELVKSANQRSDEEEENMNMLVSRIENILQSSNDSIKQLNQDMITTLKDSKELNIMKFTIFKKN